MRVEVVAVGTELLIGQTVNGNAAWLGSRLTESAHTVVADQAIGDDHDMIVAAIHLAMSRADAVIVTGGLGPTADDLTREALAAVADVPLAFDDAYAQALARRWLERFGTEAPVSNFRQAEYPLGAERLTNPKGTAPGLVLEVEGVVIVALPGVPAEMEALYDEQVGPMLRRRAGWEGSRLIRVLRSWGIPESTVGERLDDLFLVDGNPAMALLAGDGEIKVRLMAQAPTDVEVSALLEPVADEVRRRLGTAVFAVDEETVETRIHDLAAAEGWTVAVAESLTAGLVLHRLTDPPGASSVVMGGMVVYAADSKRDPLGVPEGVLAGGLVTEATAMAMAVAVADRFGADVGVAVTGVAGPGPADGHDPGTVCIAIHTPRLDTAGTIRLPGDRERVRRYAATATLHHLRLALEGTPWGR